VQLPAVRVCVILLVADAQQKSGRGAGEHGSAALRVQRLPPGRFVQLAGLQMQDVRLGLSLHQSKIASKPFVTRDERRHSLTCQP
jgi:hypothetical protein